MEAEADRQLPCKNRVAREGGGKFAYVADLSRARDAIFSRLRLRRSLFLQNRVELVRQYASQKQWARARARSSSRIHPASDRGPIRTNVDIMNDSAALAISVPETDVEYALTGAIAV